MGMMARKYGLSRSACNRLVACGVPFSLFLATAYLCETMPIKRDLDMVELFAGRGSLTEAGKQIGLDCCKFDLVNTKADDILAVAGFLRALRLVLRLRVGGLLWAGTPCSSWVYMNRGTSCRTASEPLGNQSQPSVRRSNIMVARVALLFMVAAARHAAWACEQPMSSLMDKHPRLQQLRSLCAGWSQMGTCVCVWQVLGSSSVNKIDGQVLKEYAPRGCRSALGWGASAISRQSLRSCLAIGWALSLVMQNEQLLQARVSVFAWPRCCLKDLQRRLTKSERENRGLSSHGIAKKYVNSWGAKKVRGGPRLKCTQVYTLQFSRAVAMLKKNYMLSVHLEPDARRTCWQFF